MSRKSIIVVGAGASGLMAAGHAAELGAKITLLEKMKSPARKLCISGKGRCNITNTAELQYFIQHFGKSGRFLHQAFSRFFSHDIMNFFEKKGLPLITERGGRVFPASGKSIDVLNVLLKWLEQNKVHIKYTSGVDGLLVENHCAIGVSCKGEKYFSDAVILATGGASYPATGSTGDGYNLAKSVGHTIVPVRPYLVPLETAGPDTGKMTGLQLKNIMVRLFINGKKKKEKFGEMAFTEYGITGPVILSLSGYIVDSLRKGERVSISIDLKPALDGQKLDVRLIRDLNARKNEEFNQLLRGLLPRELIPICLEHTDIPYNKKPSQITGKERLKLRNWLKDYRFQIKGYRSFKEAIITAGGVATNEVNPRTMESLLIRNLYFGGELLDIQADTGGYNLTAAFSTGWLAGEHASLSS